jgi:hypothetical protein
MGLQSQQTTVSEEQLARDCALPGGYTSGAYSAGWTRILDRFAAAAGPVHLPDRSAR